MLKQNQIIPGSPTQALLLDKIQIENLTITPYEFGMDERSRKIIKIEYFPFVDAIVVLIDASDHDRFDEARDELLDLLTDEQIADIPILILGNKIDRSSTVDENTLKEKLGIGKLCTGKEIKSGKNEKGIRPLEIFMCSCVFGYKNGFRWLSNFFH